MRFAASDARAREEVGGCSLNFGTAGPGGGGPAADEAFAREEVGVRNLWCFKAASPGGGELAADEASVREEVDGRNLCCLGSGDTGEEVGVAARSGHAALGEETSARPEFELVPVCRFQRDAADGRAVQAEVVQLAVAQLAEFVQRAAVNFPRLETLTQAGAGLGETVASAGAAYVVFKDAMSVPH